LSGKENRMPEELSGGEQQRVAMARAVANRPMIVIADEPTGNLDPATSVGIMKLLDRSTAPARPVIMATHDVASSTRCASESSSSPTATSSVTSHAVPTVIRADPASARRRYPRHDLTGRHADLAHLLRAGHGLRRNVTMTVALIVTTFVSLTLVGFGLLVKSRRQDRGVLRATA
jgi:hypothetical protein